jgi:predicted phosphohydrolase
MRVFAIGDLHLEGGSGKTMEKFGDNWRDHDRKIFESWSRIGREDDLLLLVGDISWAMRIEDAMIDLDRIGRMKGRKVMLKGNHDYWWQTATRMKKVLPASIHPLQASSVIINRVAVAGTRGWTCPGDTYFKEDDRKIYDREVGRLRLALESLAGRESEFDYLIVALHYPPTNDKHDPSGFTSLIEKHEAAACVYGHLHGEAIKTGIKGKIGMTRYHLVSADSIDFTPEEIPFY